MHRKLRNEKKKKEKEKKRAMMDKVSVSVQRSSFKQSFCGTRHKMMWDV
jgi:hypothetical protein